MTPTHRLAFYGDPAVRIGSGRAPPFGSEYVDAPVPNAPNRPLGQEMNHSILKYDRSFFLTTSALIDGIIGPDLLNAGLSEVDLRPIDENFPVIYSPKRPSCSICMQAAS